MFMYFVLIAFLLILRFNLYFQTKKVVITDLHDMVIELYQDILLCFLKREYVTTNIADVNPRNGQYQVIDQHLYLGAKVAMHIDDKEIVDNNICRKDFFERCYCYLFLILNFNKKIALIDKIVVT